MPSDRRSALFDDITFLLAQNPRVAVLRTLTATTASQSRQDLAAATDLSPATDTLQAVIRSADAFTP